MILVLFEKIECFSDAVLVEKIEGCFLFLRQEPQSGVKCRVPISVLPNLYSSPSLAPFFCPHSFLNNFPGEFQKISSERE